MRFAECRRSDLPQPEEKGRARGGHLLACLLAPLPAGVAGPAAVAVAVAGHVVQRAVQGALLALLRKRIILGQADFRLFFLLPQPTDYSYALLPQR